MIKWRAVIHVLGVLLVMLGGIFSLCALVSLYYHEKEFIPFLSTAGAVALLGLIIWRTVAKEDERIGRREGFLIVALAWITMTVMGAIPYITCNIFSQPIDALFESASGLSTTGASVMTDIESMPKGILLWRSVSQWIGGMGIIVLTVAILPILGIGGIELFVAESPGPSAEKIHPRIKETAKRLWFMYTGLTLILGLILSFLGMSIFDAINHALTTMATGGFSTKNASIAAFQSPAIEYVISFFMFLAGTNYAVIYFSLKGSPLTAMKSEEFRTYFYFLVGMISLVTTVAFWKHGVVFEQAFRDSLFQVMSIVTTTGFVTADYTAWHPALTLIFFFLLFTGASAGSTAGGIKIIRHLTFAKNSLVELKRLLHPSAIIRIKIDGKLVSPRIITHIQVFLLWYLIIFVVSSVLLSVIMADFNQPLLDSAGAVATALSNVGPAIGDLGPMNNFAAVPALGKLLLVALMIMGRLELFTILMLFTSYFWKRN
jgi:trk system potassium uptake protein TrkH